MKKIAENQCRADKGSPFLSKEAYFLFVIKQVLDMNNSKLPLQCVTALCWPNGKVLDFPLHSSNTSSIKEQWSITARKHGLETWWINWSIVIRGESALHSNLSCTSRRKLWQLKWYKNQGLVLIIPKKTNNNTNLRLLWKKRHRCASTDLQLRSSIFTVSLNNNIKAC